MFLLRNKKINLDYILLSGGLMHYIFMCWKPQRDSLINSEDPDEMPENAGFHKGLNTLSD